MSAAAGANCDQLHSPAPIAIVAVTVTAMQFSTTVRRKSVALARVRLVCAHLSPSGRCAFVPLADLAQMALRPGGTPLQADKLEQSYGKRQSHIAHTCRSCGCTWPWPVSCPAAAEAELNDESALHEHRISSQAHFAVAVLVELARLPIS